jgi:hypothetical protein
MVRRELTQALAREMFQYDAATGVVVFAKDGQNSKAGERAGHRNKANGYRSLWACGANHLEHRVIWLMVHGAWPARLIDHINGNRSDNRLANLRAATERMNCENQRAAQPHSSSGLLGVSWCSFSGKWRAQIGVDGRSVKLGRFETPEEAHAAYVKAKRELHEGCTL